MKSMIVSSLASILLAAIAGPLFAASEPVVKVDNCPVGYRTSGGYCIPIDDNADEVVPKVRSCPVGYRTSGGYCIKLEN